jgi:hypothetical protein
MTNAMDKKLSLILPYNFYIKRFYSNKYFVNWATNMQTSIFIQCPLLRAFTKLQKTPISFVMSICPSARKNSAPSGTTFVKFILQTFIKTCQENLSLVKIRQIYQALYMKT